MNIFSIISFIIFLLLIIHSKAKIKLSFIKHNMDDCLTISILALNYMPIYTKKIPFMNLVNDYNNTVSLEFSAKGKSNSENNKGIHNSYDRLIVSIYEVEKIVKKYKRAINCIKRGLIIKSMRWHTEVGVDDAAQTAIITGVIWSIKSLIVSSTTTNYNFSNLSIKVVPKYNINIFQTTINCIFTIKLGYIIIARIKMLLAQAKDGVKYEWSSDRIFNENYNGEH